MKGVLSIKDHDERFIFQGVHMLFKDKFDRADFRYRPPFRTSNWPFGEKHRRCKAFGHKNHSRFQQGVDPL